MSLKTFIAGILNHIETFIKGVLPTVKKELDIALEVVNAIKTFVDSPEADVLTAIIPGTLDDKVKEFLRAKLPAALAKLTLLDNTAGMSENELAKAAVIKINSAVGNIHSIFLNGAWQLTSDLLINQTDQPVAQVAFNDLQKIGQSYFEDSTTTAQ